MRVDENAQVCEQNGTHCILACNKPARERGTPPCTNNACIGKVALDVQETDESKAQDETRDENEIEESRAVC